jgi:hypothetical protein
LLLRLKGQFNGEAADGFTLSEGSRVGNFEGTLKDTETTVTVNWSGGGRIKSGR